MLRATVCGNDGCCINARRHTLHNHRGRPRPRPACGRRCQPTPARPLPWEQPESTNPHMKGDKVNVRRQDSG